MIELHRNGQRLAIAGELTIYHAAEVHAALVPLYAEAELDIDLSGVSEFDTSGVQVLLLAKREMAQAGHALRLSGHSQAVLDVFALLELGGLFGDPQLLPAGGAPA